MKWSLPLSLILHGLLVLPFFWPQSKEPTYSQVSTIELLGAPAHKQKKRAKKVRGSKKVKKPKEKKEQDFAKSSESTPKEGNAEVDAPEIEGGSQSGGTRLTVVAQYAQDLQLFIEKNRYYPRRALVMEQTGVVKVKLTIDAQGHFTEVEVVEPSSHEILNRAAKNLVTDLRKFKPLPSVYRGNGTFVIPINYQLQNSGI